MITPTRGKAVFWYNHEISPYTGWMGQLEARAISSIAPVLEKSAWSAKMWLNVIGDGVHELKPWRMASNWLKSPNKNIALIERLRNDFYLEGQPYLHVFRNSYKQKAPSLTSINDGFLAPLTTESIDTKSDPDVGKDDADKTEESLISEQKDDEKKTDEVETENVIKGPIPPDEGIEQTPVLGFHHKKRQEVPLGPPKRPLDPQSFSGKKVIENTLLKASLLLVEELEREELEILARTLHDKLQLQCIPLIVNPIR